MLTLLTRLQSAFSRFAWNLPKPLQFNHYRLFVSDVMHEFELGVWKAVLIHLIRILFLLKRLTKFNQRFSHPPACPPITCTDWTPRFRKVPTYGNGTIRRFTTNVSDLKQMAARMYEDVLQVRFIYIKGPCSLIPAFASVHRARPRRHASTTTR